MVQKQKTEKEILHGLGVGPGSVISVVGVSPKWVKAEGVGKKKRTSWVCRAALGFDYRLGWFGVG